MPDSRLDADGTIEFLHELTDNAQPQSAAPTLCGSIGGKKTLEQPWLDAGAGIRDRDLESGSCRQQDRRPRAKLNSLPSPQRRS